MSLPLAKPHLLPALDTLPTTPGCYLYRDAGGTVIYVGKAINLRNRVRSYFQAGANHTGKTRELVRHIEQIEYILQGSELEALLLEYNLITQYKPKYNVRWKDDKAYPYIKVHTAEAFPKVTVTRRMEQDGNRYFGPYTSAWAVHQTLEVLRRIFSYLTCDRVITGKDERACLYYDIKLCNAPCIGKVNQLEYRAMIDDLCRFLLGETAEITARLRVQMETAAEALHFEQAALYRDQLVAIERVVEKQRVISQTELDSDVIAFARDNDNACVQVFFVRNGKLMGRDYFVLEGTAEESDSDVLSAFIKQFYHQAAYVPSEVLLPSEAAEASIIQQWLADKRRDKVALSVPNNDTTRQELVSMATDNATTVLAGLRRQWEADTHKQETALAELQEALGLSEPPTRIECFDISNTQGTNSVGAMVVFHQGTPAKAHYRHFNIKTVVGPNDFASMEEVLTRRFQRWQDNNQPTKDSPGKKTDDSFARLPDLLIIDGGKGQLGVAMRVLEQFGLTERVPVVGLAKQEEELFLPHRSVSILLPRRSEGLYLVQRVRDEAHRFGLSHHRLRRSKAATLSALDAVPGIGPTRRKALLKHFGSLEAIRLASESQLMQVRGINLAVAKAVKDALGHE